MAEPTEAVPEQVTRVRQDRRTIKRPIEYTAHLDTLQLIVRFLISARDGAPFSFATFKSIWKQIGYSHIFQACPSGTGLPSLIDSLNNFLLGIIKADSLPFREVFELANPFSPLNQQSITTANGDKDDASQERLPCLTPEDVAWATAPAVQGPPVVATAVYCLYSIYYAQPGPITTKIRVSKEQQETITHLATYLAQSNALDALSLLAQLVKEKALLPGSSLQPDTSLTNVNINIATTPAGGVESVVVGGPPASSLAPGIGASYITPGLRGEDAATLREVHFHLDSTLTGLGTGHLDPLCRGYGEKLKKLWRALGQQTRVAAAGPSRAAPGGVSGSEEQQQHLEGIADLSLGKYLHEYATKKREELQLNLQYGPNWREKMLKKEKESATRATETEITTTALDGGSQPSKTTRKKAPRSRKKAQNNRLSATAAAAAAAAAHTIPGVPGNVSRQLLAREKARHIDIARRSQPWAELMGIDNVIEKELHATTTAPPQVAGYSTGLGLGIDSDEDMPFVPGLQSEFEYLAGPSDVAGGGTGTEGGGGGGDGSTKMTDTTIQGKRGKRTRNISSDTSSDDDFTSTATSTSPSSSNSSGESDPSDGEEVKMVEQATNKQRQGAAGGRGKKAAAASGGRGRGRGGKATGKSASAVSVGSGMRGGKKGRGGGANKSAGKMAVGEAVETQADVQNILREIDMALEEDARVQI